jgi:hypothetical protein
VLLGTTTPTQAFCDDVGGRSSFPGNAAALAPFARFARFAVERDCPTLLSTTGARCNSTIAIAPQSMGRLAPAIRALSDIVEP